MEWLTAVGEGWLMTLAWMAGLGAFFAVGAWLMPCNPGASWWRDLRAAGTDLMYWFVAPVAVGLARTRMLAGGVMLLGRESVSSWAGGLPLWVQCLAILAIQDVILYWIHRLFHTRRAWSFHAIHHSPTVLDWMSASRFHLVNVLFSSCLADVAVLLMGFSPKALYLLVPFNIVYSTMVHANLNWTFGPFRYLFASPVFHRWHHTSEEEGLDKNFASTFPILDVAFGTFHMPPGKVPEHFGTGEHHVPEGFWGQLVHPFLSGHAEASPSQGGRPWHVASGFAVALGIVGVIVFSVVHGHQTRTRDRHNEEAMSLFEESEYEQAIAASTEAIRSDPASALTYANRAAAHLRKGDNDSAIADCTKAIELDPMLALAYANRAGARLNRGDFREAIADATRAIELEPTLALAYANRAGAHLNVAAFEQAIGDCDEALRLDPKQATPYFTRAGAYFGLGDNDKSIRDWDAVLRIDPTQATAYANRAGAYLNKGDHARAIADYTAALEREPKLVLAELNRATAYARVGDSKAALRGFDRAIELEPTLALAYVYRAAVSLGSVDAKRSIADCTRALELDPRLALAYWIRSQAHVREREYAKGGADRKKAIELNPALGGN